MPELPEVETVRRGLEPHIVGHVVEHVLLRRPDLRIAFPPLFVERLTGRKILGVRRRAKYIIIEMEDGLGWLIHLGMSGSVRLLESHVMPHASAIKKHDHVIVQLSHGMTMIYHDPRRFGLMTLVEQGEEGAHPLLSHLGVEPLERGFTAEYLQEKFAKRSSPIKHVVMDQEVVVGVGNIYACEALFRAGIHPKQSAQDCTRLEELVVAVKSVLRAALASGGSTLRDYVNADGESGYFQHAFDVYGREHKPCTRCSAQIQRITQQGRSTFFCGVCQG